MISSEADTQTACTGDTAAALPGEDAAQLQRQADQVAELLRTLSNPNRLRVMCLLADGEKTVTAIARALALSQPVASQHLARMRNEGLVACRREGRRIHYRIADPRVHQVIAALHAAFCAAESR
ncbi:MAG: transcriptional regulator [Alphaproteobacteria bacterium]|nr:MAG: transcriptional regulator [Alphaproteobacteria bacterium]